MNFRRDLLGPVLFLTAGLLLIVVPGVSDAAEARGTPTRATPVHRFDRGAIDKENWLPALTGPARCDVSVIQVTYRSIGVRGEPITLSAALFVPENCAGPFPLLAEAHGTQSDRRRLTTEVSAGSPSITFFASQGYVVVATDYLGLGQSDYPYHPYLHADSEASAIVDSIRAARRVAQTRGIALSRKVMLFGYSQGGHAAMAAQREIERKHRGEIDLAAAAPMAGPYHLSQTFFGAWFGRTAGEENALSPALLAYTLYSYSKIYPSVCRTQEDCFAPPYAQLVGTLFPGTRDIFELSTTNVFPPGRDLDQVRNPAFSAAFLVDEHQPFREALERNDLLDWTPRTPMILCGSRKDAIVDFNNAYAAKAAFRARGVDVPIVDVADDIPATANGTSHHTEYAAPLCFAAAKKQLFDPIRSGSPD